MATQADLNGKQVLEVSCGHGGGASYLVRTLHPASCMGLDFNPAGITFCRRRHDLPGLDFVHAGFPASSPKWCVLRTGGRFLCGDFRGRSECPGWEAALADIQVRQVSERVINPEVLRGMERNSRRSMHPIGRLMPAFMRPFGRRFAGVPGTGLYRDIENGKIEYRMYCFTKE